MTTKARMVLRAMTEREINASIAELTKSIDIVSGPLRQWRMERRRLLIALAHRRRWETNPGAFQKVRDSRRMGAA